MLYETAARAGEILALNIEDMDLPCKRAAIIARRAKLPGVRIYAHSENDRGERHFLADHLRSVAGIASELAEPFGGGDLSFLAGLWHDVGKADPAWQERLIECEKGNRSRVGLDHKCAGVLLAERTMGGLAGVAGLLIHGHHGGLQDRQGYESWLEEKRRLPGPAKAIEVLSVEVNNLTDYDPPGLPVFVSSGREAELFLRFCYSALVDADSLDTEAHHLGGAPPDRGSRVTLADLWTRYETFLAGQPPVTGIVNRVRREVHDACLQMAAMPPGIFRLTVPTGGGKTRSAMAFGLRHGLIHGLRRVIVAVPFTTITEQTASVYWEIFERGYPDTGRVVLEHHSAATEGVGAAGEEEDGFTREDVWQRLTAENWDAPVVVTTTVQLFESLFSNRRSKVRKLHNLAGSVIIIDEAQTLPTGLLSPILDVVGQLSRNYGVSVVLSTATQPVFEHIEEFRKVPALEIVADHARHFQELKRVEYEWDTEERTGWREVAERMRSERNVLTIVNTKRHAMELLDELNDPNSLHLSTLLCGAHRRDVVRGIQRRLSAGEPCRVVSTQVVEAGVDLDFAAVFRAEAPLDAIIQAAGRCNREGKLSGLGRVVVFKPPDDASPPGVYRSGRDIADIVRRFTDFDPNDPETVRTYFDWLYELVVDSDQNRIQDLREDLNFPKVAERFRMIPDDTYDVVVDYPTADVPKVNRLVEQLQTRRGPVREILRRLQPHLVSVRRYEANCLQTQGRIAGIIPGLGRWHGSYDQVRGISTVDPDLIF